VVTAFLDERTVPVFGTSAADRSDQEIVK